MPTVTFASVDALQEKLPYLDESENDADLRALLEEGHRQLEGVVGEAFTDVFQFDRLQSNEEDLDNVLDLTFSPVFEVKRVVRGDEVIVDSADYSVDYTEGTITIDSRYMDNNVDRYDMVRVRYVPAVFRDLELWLAVQNNAVSERIQFPESEEAQVYENAAKKAQQLINIINRRVPTGTISDGAVRRGTK